jgi:hypothetical protein
VAGTATAISIVPCSTPASRRRGELHYAEVRKNPQIVESTSRHPEPVPSGALGSGQAWPIRQVRVFFAERPEPY